ncbi:PREDICTED: general transcription factor IIH subunit 3 [Polistes canadensis]|uniref:general transcription factor IIH subunit 3 n=1 Tax=Polistes canadensis TaxID=91411 RepID=UPI000718D21F|nr:PREDICTED: general transcription factor IIH subunit 3 [Polistes canadensis]XP_014612324.1 PREDICTED: general transcription factor IIH subunit 3 [Polistes canadensis]XP_014612325.1 PREDICTED: general transcription factor IIH subunit 3 [Polistes canadensis]
MSIEKTSEKIEKEKNLLIVVLDVNPLQRIVKEEAKILTQCLDSTIVFANAHLMQASNNQLAVMACHGHGAMFLYPSDKDNDIRQIDGQYEKFTELERTVRRQIQLFVNQIPSDTSLNGESLISGALSMALCYISRVSQDKDGDEKFCSRILVITASNDSTMQYMNYMNIFFTAQKMGVILDVCSLDQELTLLQQGCDITGGNYLKVPQLNGLLQYLLWVFLPDSSVRSKLVLPPPVEVDYRAACFCHQELVDIGYVCSVCLSIFCKFSPICTTCHTVFKMPGPIPMKMKKKKKNLDITH